MARTNIRHSTGTARWGSPAQVIAIARRVLGIARDAEHPIWVDPFSEAEFNARVGAVTYMDGTSGRDGYRDRWIVDDPHCPRADQLLALDFNRHADSSTHRYTAFVNPPNETDELDAGEATKRAWRLLDQYHRLGWLGGGAVYVAFNLNQLQTLQLGGSTRSPLHGDFLRCVPDRRLGIDRHSSCVPRDKEGNERAPTLQEVKRICTRYQMTHGKGDITQVMAWAGTCESAPGASSGRPRPTDFDKILAEETGDQPSHPMFFVLLPSTNQIVAAEQTRLFDSMASELGEVW